MVDDRLVYLDGNSLGCLPRSTVERLDRVVRDEWGRELVGGWHHWVELATSVGDRLGRAVLGAGRGQVAVADSTTVNLYRLGAAALAARPDRPVIVGDGTDFATDRYVLQGLARDFGRRLVLVDGDPRDRLGADVALLCWSQVHFRTGELVDVAAVTQAAHRAGALTLWDLSHAAGSVPVALDRAGADLATGCTYKYLHGGPGAPAWLYVRTEHQAALRPPVWGWFAQADQFVMGPEFDPAPGVAGWLTGTPPILGLAAVEEGVAAVAAAGVDAIRAKSELLTALAVELFDAWLAPAGCRLVTPRRAEARGSHVAVSHPEAWRLCQALIHQFSVVPDFRPPDVVRLGMAPLTTRFVDVWDGLERLGRALTGGHYKEEDPVPGRVT